jgi:hypothetical protein
MNDEPTGTTAPSMPFTPAPGASLRFRQARVKWLPILLIAVDAVLLMLAMLLMLVLAPLALALVLLAMVLRLLLPTITGGRWFGSDRTRGRVSAGPPVGVGSLSNAVRRELADRYRPCLILFPEDPELGPPYRADERAGDQGADYHPRAVEIFLDHARLRRGHTQWLPEFPDPTGPAAVRANLGTAWEEESSLEVPWLHGGNPFRIARHLFPFGRLLRLHWALPLVPKSECGCGQTAWARYSDIVRVDNGRPPADRRYPLTLYARVVQGRELPGIGEDHPLAEAIAVQYWWFLFYNDAWNRHQGDWEVVTVFLHPDNGTYRPQGAAYSAHELGRWRRWEDVHRVDETGEESEEGSHPVVYSARGSHASYFEFRPDGYHPAVSRKLRVPFIGDCAIPQFALQSSRTTDWVAAAGIPPDNGVRVLVDNVRLMPPEPILRDLTALRAEDDWWWLGYRGLWGAPEFLPFSGGSGPRGPRWQGTKWSNPFHWVMHECLADDLPYWLEMFAGWEPADSSAASERPPAEVESEPHRVAV